MRNVLVLATGIRKGFPPLGRRKNKEVLSICVWLRQREVIC